MLFDAEFSATTTGGGFAFRKAFGDRIGGSHGGAQLLTSFGDLITKLAATLGRGEERDERPGQQAEQHPDDEQPAIKFKVRPAPQYSCSS